MIGDVLHTYGLFLFLRRDALSVIVVRIRSKFTILFADAKSIESDGPQLVVIRLNSMSDWALSVTYEFSVGFSL